MTKAEKRQLRALEREARNLLRSDEFFNRALDVVAQLGVIGEEGNVLVVYLVGVTRLLNRPLNLFVKGASASGKNRLVSTVLKLFPKDCIREITSSSAAAWSYAEDELRHRIVYVQEHATSGAMPTRQLISEQKIVHRVAERWGRSFSTETHVTRGPFASICTTTKSRLQVDDETRNISIWMDESPEQTARIVMAYTAPKARISRETLKVWRYAQELLRRRARVPISFPVWFCQVARRVYTADVRVRRYWPAFVEACRTVALIRSFTHHPRFTPEKIEIDYADFAITARIFKHVFSESLHRLEGDALSLHKAVERTWEKQHRRPVTAKQLAAELQISYEKASRLLRSGVETNAIRRINKPLKANKKLFAPADMPSLIPDPEKLFSMISSIPEVSFTDPLTRKKIVYRRSRA